MALRLPRLREGSYFPSFLELRRRAEQALLAVVQQAYRAINTLTGREVALKMLRADSPVPEVRTYFENERDILARLNHPHIPTFYEYVEAKMPGIALKFIDGKDGETLLAELPEGSFLNPRSVVEWGIQIADALAYLHNHIPPVVFRDLKPSHVMVGAQNQALLVDFNLVKIMPESKYLDDADLMGTEGFSAPEQYGGLVARWWIYILWALHCIICSRALILGTSVGLPMRRLVRSIRLFRHWCLRE